MKKLLLLLLLSNSFFAQTIYQENFNAPQSLTTSGWTLFSEDANTGPANNWVRTQLNGNGVMASFSWYGNVALSPDNYTFSPAINLTSFSGPLKLSYKHAAGDPDFDAENYTLYVTNSPTVAAATVVSKIHNQSTMDGINSLTEITFDISAYAGQTVYLCFRHHNVINEFNLIIDDVKVEKMLPNNLSLESVVIESIISPGNRTFTGVVKNKGTNNVTSYSVTWQSNGGVLNTYEVTNVNILPEQTNAFLHTVPLNAQTAEVYNLIFNVSSVNGVSDSDTTNNTLNKTTQVPSGSTTFKPLIEKFTASTCGPCAFYNTNTFTPFYTTQNQNFNYIAYQMNFPGAGDPYHTAEGGVRRDYYAVNAITSVKMNGVDYSTSNGISTLTNKINAEALKPAYFGLTADKVLTSSTATVNYNITPYLTGNFVVYAAVIEKETINNIGTNGETSFKHVMMKMLPNANGTVLNMTSGTALSGQLTASLLATNIEDFSDLEVVVFIQNPETKQIMQSFKATEPLSTPSNSLKNTVKLYPNPANNFFKLSNIELADVTVADVTGKTVLKLKNVTNESAINVTELNAGIYFVTINSNDASQTIKFVKK